MINVLFFDPQAAAGDSVKFELRLNHFVLALSTC